MAYPKKADCPKCGAPGVDLEVYTYDNGWRHVECDACHYLGPGEGNIRQAIQSHNQGAPVASAQYKASHETAAARPPCLAT